MSNTELSEEQMAWLCTVRDKGGTLDKLEKWFDTEPNYSTRAAANKYKTHINKWTKETDIETKVAKRGKTVNPHYVIVARVTFSHQKN